MGSPNVQCCEGTDVLNCEWLITNTTWNMWEKNILCQHLKCYSNNNNNNSNNSHFCLTLIANALQNIKNLVASSRQ